MKKIILGLLLLVSGSAFADGNNPVLICRDNDDSVFKIWNNEEGFNALHENFSMLQVSGMWQVDGETRYLVMFENGKIASKDKDFDVHRGSLLFNDKGARGVFHYSADTQEAVIKFTQHKDENRTGYSKTAKLTCQAP